MLVYSDKPIVALYDFHTGSLVSSHVIDEFDLDKDTDWVDGLFNHLWPNGFVFQYTASDWSCGMVLPYAGTYLLWTWCMEYEKVPTQYSIEDMRTIMNQVLSDKVAD